MAKANKFLCTSALIGCLAASLPAGAEEIKMNTARMQAMDKITGRVSEIDVPVNGEVKFGSFSIVVRDCKATPPEETPENYAFVDVADTTKDGQLYNIFKGWMLSSSPALNAVEHPIYDVWLLKCLNSNVKQEQLLSAEALRDRDGLPKKEEMEELSKEALKAEELKKEEAESQAAEASENQAEPLLSEIKDEQPAELPAVTVPPLEEKVIEVETIQDAKGVGEEDLPVVEVPQEQAPQMLLNIPEAAPAQPGEPQSLIPAEIPSSEAPVDPEKAEASPAAEPSPASEPVLPVSENNIPTGPQPQPAVEEVIIKDVKSEELPVVEVPEETEAVEEEDQFLDDETQSVLESELKSQE